ncbi:MAG: Lrp/AsnC family transcriptional regulator [Xanthomonadales bacterium]|nr:Lrp/AsnC family transcriptional regulator [Xanthomonadales bacterium]
MTDILSEWTFLSNYAHVLLCLAENPRARLRDVADRVGITERTTMRLITQLDQAGILKRVKNGRCNEYVIDTSEHLRHPIEAHCTVGQLLRMNLSSAAIKNIEKRSQLHQRSTSKTR